MTLLRSVHVRGRLAALVLMLAAIAAVIGSINAHAYTAQRYYTHIGVSAHADIYYSGVNELERSTAQSVGTAESGAGIADGATGNRAIQYCSGAGCFADTGDFSCNSWDNGSQPYIHNKSDFTSYFNGDYYSCLQ